MSVVMEQLPDLDTDYALNVEQAASSYRTNGHILLRQLATRDEMAVYRRVILNAVDEQFRQVSPLEQRSDYGKMFVQIMHLWERDAAMRKFSLAKRFAKVAAELMGVETVRMYHDQVLFKEPGGAQTPWHQDQFYIPLETRNVLTMWMPLVDISEEMGAMQFASGSHLDGSLANVPTSHQAGQKFKDLIRERRWPILGSGAMAAGDATFHSGWTVHCAAGNSTGQLREVITVLYYEDGARVSNSDSTVAIGAAAHHLAGRKRGELADSAINPIVYRRR